MKRRNTLKMEVLKRLEAGGQPKELVDNPTAGSPGVARVARAVLALVDEGLVQVDRPWHYSLTPSGQAKLRRTPNDAGRD